MGIRNETLPLIDFAARLLGGYAGLKMCELGNQQMRDQGISAKEYFTGLEVNHISFDLNGQDGALQVNINEPLSGDLKDFDLITNFGTSEHIPDQYQVFKNMHDLIRVGGMIVHCLPLIGYWNAHGLYSYDRRFLDDLSRANGYRLRTGGLIERRKDKKLLTCAILQKPDLGFISKTTFQKLGGIYEHAVCL